jgi:hypothetical protein
MAPLLLRSLQEAATLHWPGLGVEWLPEIDSTNSELMRRLRQGQLAPTLLLADVQSAGRGRMGRQWHSLAGDALTFSLALPFAPMRWQGLSLAVGVAVAQGLHADVRLKWPNDLFLHGGKLGGILVETSLQAGHIPHVVVGVGINLQAPAVPEPLTRWPVCAALCPASNRRMPCCSFCPACCPPCVILKATGLRPGKRPMPRAMCSCSVRFSSPMGAGAWPRAVMQTAPCRSCWTAVRPCPSAVVRSAFALRRCKGLRARLYLHNNPSMNPHNSIAVKYAKRGRHSRQKLFGLSIVLLLVINVVFAAFQVDLLRAIGLPSRHYSGGDPLSQQVRPEALRVIAGRELSGAASAAAADPANKP